MSGTVNIPGACRIGSVGKVTSELTELKISKEGEILFRAPGNMLGYYKASDKTAETIVDGWIRTGDKGVIDAEGFLRITGRVKEIFKTAKGKYVAPAPIENRFTTNPYLDQLCLVGRGLPQTVLLTVLSPSAAEVSRDQLTASLAAQLEEVNAPTCCTSAPDFLSDHHNSRSQARNRLHACALCSSRAFSRTS